MTLGSILPFLRKVIGLNEISPSNLTDDAAKRLRRSQIRGAIEQNRVFVVGNTLFCPILAFQAWDTGMNWLVLVWTGLMLICSWWLVWAWHFRYETDGRKSDMDKFVNETKINASLWCTGIALFYPTVDGDAKSVLTCILVGSLALGTMGISQAPVAAFWFLGAQAFALIAVPTLNWFVVGSPHDLLLGGLAVVASAAIFNATLERAKAQMRAFQNHEALVHKTEVVDLLLKDYEDQSSEWIWRTDSNGCLVSCPRQVLDLMCIDDGEMPWTNLVEAIAAKIEHDGQAEVEKVSSSFSAVADLNDVTLPLRQDSNGALKWIVMKGRPQFDNEIFSGYRGIFVDATATVEAKRRIEFLAEHDPLTGTYNRNHVHSRLAELDPKKHRALVFLVDLDGFKQVNDGYGHSVGDDLLKVVTERLRSAVGGAGLVARMGGDEFLVLCKLKAHEVHLIHHELGQQILNRLSEPFIVDQFDISLSGSVGIAKFPQDTDNGLTLLNRADLALYAAKRGGRNQCANFTMKMMDGLQKRIVVTDRLRKTMQDDGISSYYQPQFCARTGKLIGAEALARWKDPELGFVGPDVFIPVAEETGLIHELGEKLLRRACLDALNWAPQENGIPPRLAVNLSPVQFVRGNIAKTVKRILAETGLPPGRLEVEITEGVLIDDVQATRFILEEISDTGVSVSLDDFGTGYSSLNYVRALPLDRLKIDRSFISEIAEPEAQSIVSAIVGLCERLNLGVVAEGVESEEAARILRELGCDVLQGYFFSRPLAADNLQKLTLGDNGRELDFDLTKSSRPLINRS